MLAAAVFPQAADAGPEEAKREDEDEGYGQDDVDLEVEVREERIWLTAVVVVMSRVCNIQAR